MRTTFPATSQRISNVAMAGRLWQESCATIERKVEMKAHPAPVVRGMLWMAATGLLFIILNTTMK
jgi:hypothetical protein